MLDEIVDVIKQQPGITLTGLTQRFLVLNVDQLKELIKALLKDKRIRVIRIRLPGQPAFSNYFYSLGTQIELI